MWWWVSGFLLLLAVGDNIAGVLPMPADAADTLIRRLLVFSFLGAAVCIGLDIKEGIRAAYGKFADRLGMDVEPDGGAGFMEQAAAAPWTAWARAGQFQITDVLRSRSKTPEFRIFDLHYREAMWGLKRPTVTTFFVVTMSETAPAQVQDWMVPKGYRAIRRGKFLYVYRARSWFGGGDRLGITAIPDVLRVALTIASDVEGLGESGNAALKEQIILAMEAASGLNPSRPLLLVLAWGLLATLLANMPVPARPLVDMVVVQVAFACAVYGSVWRLDRNPTLVLFPWLLSLAMFWMPPAAFVLLGLAACEASFGLRSIAAGLHVVAVLAVAMSLYGVQHHNFAIAISGAPMFVLLGLIQDACARSKRTRRNDGGALEWQVNPMQ